MMFGKLSIHHVICGLYQCLFIIKIVYHPIFHIDATRVKSTNVWIIGSRAAPLLQRSLVHFFHFQLFLHCVLTASIADIESHTASVERFCLNYISNCGSSEYLNGQMKINMLHWILTLIASTTQMCWFWCIFYACRNSCQFKTCGVRILGGQLIVGHTRIVIWAYNHRHMNILQIVTMHMHKYLSPLPQLSKWNIYQWNLR